MITYRQKLDIAFQVVRWRDEGLTQKACGENLGYCHQLISTLKRKGRLVLHNRRIYETAADL